MTKLEFQEEANAMLQMEGLLTQWRRGLLGGEEDYKGWLGHERHYVKEASTTSNHIRLLLRAARKIGSKAVVRCGRGRSGLAACR